MMKYTSISIIFLAVMSVISCKENKSIKVEQIESEIPSFVLSDTIDRRIKLTFDSLENLYRQDNIGGWGNELLVYDNRQLLSFLISIYDDSDKYLKDIIIVNYYRIAENNKSLDIRRAVVEQLLKARTYSSHSSLLLSFFHRKDFSQKAKGQIAKMYIGEERRDILLVGVANVESKKNHLKKIIDSYPNQMGEKYWCRRSSWYARLALIRMGENQHLEYCLNRIKEEKSPSILYYIVEDLAYMRTSESVQLLRDFVFSEIEVPSDGDAIGFKVGEGALENLLQIIQNPPENISSRYVSVRDLENGRKWLKSKPILTIIN